MCAISWYVGWSSPPQSTCMYTMYSSTNAQILLFSLVNLNAVKHMAWKSILHLLYEVRRVNAVWLRKERSFDFDNDKTRLAAGFWIYSSCEGDRAPAATYFPHKEYHRRWWAWRPSSEWDRVFPHRKNHRNSVTFTIVESQHLCQDNLDCLVRLCWSPCGPYT